MPIVEVCDLFESPSLREDTVDVCDLNNACLHELVERVYSDVRSRSPLYKFLFSLTGKGLLPAMLIAFTLLFNAPAEIS